MEDTQYETLKHHLACENRLFSVFLDTIGKNGETLVENYMSIKPKTSNKENITGVLTLPINNGKYGLIKIYRHPIQEYSWELPGGFLEPNETSATSAIRELKEEVGLVCEEKDLICLGSFYASPGLVSGKINFFSAEKCVPIMQTDEPELGICQFKWFTEREIEEFIKKGLIHDISTILAIYRRMRLNNNTSNS